MRDLESPFVQERLYERARDGAHDEAVLELLEAESPFFSEERRGRVPREDAAQEEAWESEDFYDERAPHDLEGETADFEAEAFEEEEAGTPAPVTDLIGRLGGTFARHRKRSVAEEQAALLRDYQDTLAGARLRYAKAWGKGSYTQAGITRAWIVSREEEVRFLASPFPRTGIAPPAERMALVSHPLVGHSDIAPVAPVVGRFAEELKRRYPSMRAENYRGHGGGSFDGRGYSLDLYIDESPRDDRGFWRVEDAVRFLREVHAAAAAVGCDWRVIYNDATVADAINRATGRRNVIFVGNPVRNRAGQVVGLNWHGPHPLILHFHLDLAPGARGLPASLPPSPAPAQPAATPVATPSRDAVRFAQRVLNIAEGERLAADGALGPLTRAALERFRRRSALGRGGVLDATTELALVQRALEELAQASMFAPGVRDANTEQALRNFKAERGLPPDARIDGATRAALLAALERRTVPSPAPAAPALAPAGATDWTRVPENERMAYVVRLLTERYRFPLHGAAGLVGNLLEESGVLPNRIEGSRAATPMRAQDFSGVERDFTPEEIMNRNFGARQGPRLPGVGLAQWTSAGRRAGLFRHRFNDRVLGSQVLFDMDAQVDYLVAELASGYAGVNTVLRREGVTLEAASDEVVYNFETPASVLSTDTPRRKLPREHPSVQAVFARRRAASRRALQAFQAARREQELALELEEPEALEESAHDDVHEAFGEAQQLHEHLDDLDAELEEGEALAELEEELDPALLDLAERVMAREAPELEDEVRARWTRCFSAEDVARVEQAYRENEGFASANGVDRCSCIVMLNVALGQLLSLPLKENRARGTSTRKVQMARLTTQSIERAMRQLRASGHAQAATVLNFLDRRGRRAGTLRPERLRESVQARVLALSAAAGDGCWAAFGLSIMDGYHSVLLLVDRTGTEPKIFWLDQFSPAITDDVTSTLDERITTKTQTWWDDVKARKNKGYNTTIRIWPLRKRAAPAAGANHGN